MKRNAETISKSPGWENSYLDWLQTLGSPTDLWRSTEGAGGIGQGNALLAQAEVRQDDVTL